MPTKKSFFFHLGDPVRLAGTDEIGHVVGRAHYLDSNPQYLVRYAAANGRLVEAWWAESALTTPANPRSLSS